MEKQIISEKSLMAVEELVTFLKQHARRRDIFHAVGSERRINKIVSELEKGGKRLRNLLGQNWVREGASALEAFLMRLRKPLVPPHIQALGLDYNPGVSPVIVAQDILGLLRQDVSGRQSRLIVTVLDLLHCILKNSPTDELSGCNIPITMLMIFFNMEKEHVVHWRRVAMVFVELIHMAPTYLNIPGNFDNEERLMLVENFNIHDEMPLNRPIFQRTILEINNALRNILLPGYGENVWGYEYSLSAEERRPQRSRYHFVNIEQ